MSASHALLLYVYVEDVLERRVPHRDGHLELIRSWKDDGRLLMAGPLGDPPTGGAFVFQVNDPDEVEDFVANDPYVAEGIVTSHSLERWTLV
jgi:uncharacterized protein YciI